MARLRPARRTLARSVALLALVALQIVACAHQTTIYDDGKLTVMLRTRGKKTQGFDHPVTIAPVRLSHILSRIDVRLSAKDGQKRVPAIPLGQLEAISAGLAKGLAEANPGQEVVIMSIRTQKHFGLFNQDYLTSLTSYQKDGTLFVHMGRVDWEVPPRREDRLPEPEPGEFPQSFRIVPSEHMDMIDQQALAIAWRDDLFERPTRTRLTPDGKLVRRTILMESDDPEPEPEAEPSAKDKRPAPLPPNLSPDALRALADLEEERRDGTINEATYARKRLEILEKATAY